MKWTRIWNKIDGTTTVSIELDGEGGVEYISDNTSAFPKWREYYYDTAFDVFLEMEYYHENPEYEEV